MPISSFLCFNVLAVSQVACSKLHVSDKTFMFLQMIDDLESLLLSFKKAAQSPAIFGSPKV